MLEIEPHPSGPLAQFVRAHQRRQRLRDSPQVAVPGAVTAITAVGARGTGGARRAAFGRLDFLPRDALFRGRHGAGPAEHMRVTAQQLVAYRTGHRIEVEMTGLMRHLRMKDHLEQQVPQFVLQMLHVAAFRGVGHLVCFLDGVGRDGRECLLPVPRAPIGGAQALHDGEEFPQARRLPPAVDHCARPLIIAPGL